MNELPPGWADATIGDLAQTIRGLTYKKEQALPQAKAGFAPLLRATNIQSGQLLFEDDLVFVPESLIRDEQWLRPGDAVIASSSGSSSVVGKSAPVLQRWHGTFGAFCTVLRPSLHVEPRFLAYFAASPEVRARWSAVAAGTNINNLKSSDVAETHVPLPPLAEQRRIVVALEEQLSRLDAADQSLCRSKQRLEQLKVALLAKAIDGDWPIEPLSNVLLSLRNGIFVSRPAAAPPGTAIFRISAVRSLALDVNDVRYAPESETQHLDYLVSEGDLLFTRYSGNPEYVGACARVPLLPQPTLHPDKLIRAIVNRDLVEPAFVELACATGVTRAAIRARRKTTAGQVGIAGSQLKSVPIPLPPLGEQRHIVAEVERQLSLIGAMHDALGVARRRSASLRRSILERAFCGGLVPQDPNEEPATILLERIAAERAATAPSRRRQARV